MKNGDIEILGKVVSALEKYLPVMEYGLYTEYLGVYEGLKAKNEREKQSYQQKADYYRESSRKWRQGNKERYYAYQKKWRDSKRTPKKPEDG